MKKTLLTVACAGLFSLSSVFLASVACRVFVKDMVEVHGASLFGGVVQVNSVSVDWQKKYISLQDICVLDPDSAAVKERSSLYCADSVLLKLADGLSLDWQQSALLPDPLQIDLIEIQSLSVAYDIDSAGGNLRNLRTRLSDMSAITMKNRANSGITGHVNFPLLRVSEVKVSGLAANANSQKNPARSRIFSAKDIVLSEVGGQGAVSSEVVGQIVRAIADHMDAEAISQGVVQVVPAGQSRQRNQSTDSETSPQEESSAGKAVRSIGEGFKKAGTGLWQGTKKLFD
jgi:hypothetical protein